MSIHQILQKDVETHVDFQFKDALSFFKSRLLILLDAPLQIKLIFDFHATNVGGQVDVARTFHRLASNSYWRQMASIRNHLSKLFNYVNI